MLRNEKGFTLIEIIAVLVILGILAAVAIPKYMSLMETSRQSAAQGAIAEGKSRCSSMYAQQLMQQVTPTTTTVGGSISTDYGDDFGVTIDYTNAAYITITVGTVKGTALTTTVVGTWYLPTTT